MTDHPAFAPSILLGLGLAALGAAFNLGIQWNRQDRISEITSELKYRDELLPARVMKDRYDTYERIIADMQGKIAMGPVRDAENAGHIENLNGKLDSVWQRQAQDQRDISGLAQRLSAIEARFDMLIGQVKIHDEHDFQSERGEAHPR
jgi:hypothetical protein